MPRARSNPSPPSSHSRPPFHLHSHNPLWLWCSSHRPHSRSHVPSSFFRFLRCSEFTASTLLFVPSRHACISDLFQFSEDSLVFQLKRTKTNASGRPTPVFFFRSQSPLNPFEASSNYLSFRKLQSSTSTEPLFISESGHVATRFWFHHHLRQVLSLSGLSPIHYSGHSFRIGAATSAPRNGVPEHLIQILGRWSSQAYHRYIRSDLKDLRSTQSILL